MIGKTYKLMIGEKALNVALFRMIFTNIPVNMCLAAKNSLSLESKAALRPRLQDISTN